MQGRVGLLKHQSLCPQPSPQSDPFPTSEFGLKTPMDSNFSQFTGIDYGISYEHISLEWDEETCRQYCSRIKEQYAKQTKSWTDDLHSEWLTRNYLAVKMILAASVMLTSFEYCRKKNVHIVQPYLLYYSTLSCCRCQRSLKTSQ